MALTETIDLLQRIRVYTVTFDPASVATVVGVEQDVTVTGVLATDYLIGFEPGDESATACAIGAARVKAADTIAVWFCNPTAGALDPASGTWKFYVASAEA
jgi:hypothetical protein